MKHGIQRDTTLWRPQSAFAAVIGSRGQLAAFNDGGGVAVSFEVLRARTPRIILRGAQNETFCLWETRSASGFVTQPKFNAKLVTLRFVTSGQITYRHRRGDFRGLPHLATFIGFDDIRQVEASQDFGAVNATIALDVLAAAYAALTGDEAGAVPLLAPVAEVASDGMRALYHTVARMQRRIAVGAEQNEILLPLLQEIMCYQLLSAWPKAVAAPARNPGEAPSRAVGAAIDYIEAYAGAPLNLAEVAAAAGVSVGALQRAVRSETGQSLAQLALSRRARHGLGGLAGAPPRTSGPDVGPRRAGTGVAAGAGDIGTAPIREGPLVRAQRLIERDLHRADLTPARVAAELGVSVRRLHLAFVPTGESFGRHLLARRLARADRMLRENPHLSVTEAAYACGFEGLSTFFRGYRAAYGASPGSRRGGAREAGTRANGSSAPDS